MSLPRLLLFLGPAPTPIVDAPGYGGFRSDITGCELEMPGSVRQVALNANCRAHFGGASMISKGGGLAYIGCHWVY